MSDIGHALFTLFVWCGLLGAGLALLSIKWPKYWKPVLEAYLEVVKVSAVLALNCVYYTLLGTVKVVQFLGQRLLQARRAR